MRKFYLVLITAAAVLFAFGFATASAQVIVGLTPTTDGGGVYNTHSGAYANGVSVNQRVNLILPRAFGLAIDTAHHLNFDLRHLSDKNSQIVCVSGTKAVDVNVGNDGGVHPMGTYYTFGASFPNVSVQGGKQITTYPPVAYNTDGTVDTSSKQYFVCYKSFVLEKFSNVSGWHVSVSRNDASSNALGNVYIQDNLCSAFGSESQTYLFPLPDQGSVANLFKGASEDVLGNLTHTTGYDAASKPAACGSNTSWLNDLVVMAIEIDGQPAGRNSSVLTYTIQATNPVTKPQ